MLFRQGLWLTNDCVSATKPRYKKCSRRSRRDTESDKHISKEKRDFKLLGSATVYEKEIDGIKVTVDLHQNDSDGFFI